MRIVKDNLQLPIRIDGVGKGILDFHDISALNRGEEVIAHGDAHVANDLGANILPLDIGPGLDRKSVVFRIIAVSADKVGQSAFKIQTELLDRC